MIALSITPTWLALCSTRYDRLFGFTLFNTGIKTAERTKLLVDVLLSVACNIHVVVAAAKWHEFVH